MIANERYVLIIDYFSQFAKGVLLTRPIERRMGKMDRNIQQYVGSIPLVSSFSILFEFAARIIIYYSSARIDVPRSSSSSLSS